MINGGVRGAIIGSPMMYARKEQLRYGKLHWAEKADVSDERLHFMCSLECHIHCFRHGLCGICTLHMHASPKSNAHAMQKSGSRMSGAHVYSFHWLISPFVLL